ncbi:MAG: DUF4328 domain-containing protein [Planctomycetia bacterium]|nr:DUF4328 domain-containing protein [Planctomycetia bacterium]
MSQYSPYSPYASPAPLPPAARVYGYAPLDGLVRLVTILILALLATDVVITIMDIVVTVSFPGLNFENEAEAGTLLGLGLAMIGIGLLSFALVIAAAIVFCVFAVRANKNARSLGAQGMNFAPGWCAGWWFIPIANWFMPYRCMTEIYRASDPQGGFGWSSTAVPGTFPLWWGLWVSGNIISGVANRMGFSDIPEIVRASTWLGLVGTLLLIPAGVLAIVVVRSIAERQGTTASGVGRAVSPYASFGMPGASPYGGQQFFPPRS